MGYNIKIQHEKFGVLLEEKFVNATQFKIFLKMIQGCLALNEDLTFFNGADFLIHVPNSYLKMSVIQTSVDFESLTEQLMKKSKLEV